MAKTPPHLMQTFARRPLTAGEVALGRLVFGDEIDWGNVRILQAPALGFGAMAPFGGAIIFSNWRAWRDFAGAKRGEQGWFIHELMHVWQDARGMALPLAKLGALGKAAYAYKPKPQAKLRDYNIERQAEIARHLFLARMDAAEAGAPPRAWLEQIWQTRFG
jgi:hypothetical protein